MHKIIVGLLALAVAVPATAQVQVKGYVRKDGTYVAPHSRTAPNSTTMDNWSTKPNVNPYTGREGTRDAVPTYRPYTPPSSGSTYQPYKAPCYYNCGNGR